MTPQTQQSYRTIIGLVADEIWLRHGWSQAYCAVLRPGAMAR